MRDDPEEAAQREVGDPERAVRSGDLFQPRAVLDVSMCILPVCVDEDVDVEEDQSVLSIRSSRAELSSRSTRA
jgi:hypothetical protein